MSLISQTTVKTQSIHFPSHVKPQSFTCHDMAINRLNFNLHSFILSEFRNIGLFFGLHIYEQATNKDHQLSWLMFIWIMRTYITTTPQEYQALRDYIDMDTFMVDFKKTWELVYSIHSCSYNYHAFEHLPMMREVGSLSDQCAYPFEGLFQVMLGSLYPGTRNITRQAHKGAYANYMGASGGHTHQKKITYQPLSRNHTINDSLIYTCTGFWCVQKVLEDGTLDCHRVIIETWHPRCRHGVHGVLNMSMVGVYIYVDIDHDTQCAINKKNVLGKLIQVDKYIIKCPKEILLEST